MTACLTLLRHPIAFGLSITFATAAVLLVAVQVTSYLLLPPEHYLEATNPQGENRWQFSDAGVEASFPGGATKLEWPWFDQVVRDQAFYYLYRGRRFTLIPRRGLLGTSADADLALLVRRHIGALKP